MKNEWISVEDRLPKEDCIVYLKEKLLGLYIHTMSYHENVSFIGNRFEHDVPSVTHWMPLPEPPKEGL